MIQVEKVDKRWLSNEEAQKYLGVSKDFMKNLRDSARIHFYKVGKTVWYELKDLDNLVLKAQVV